MIFFFWVCVVIVSEGLVGNMGWSPSAFIDTKRNRTLLKTPEISYTHNSSPSHMEWDIEYNNRTK